MTRVVESLPIGEHQLATLQLWQENGAFRLREGDEKECLALGLSSVEAITKSVQESIASYVVFIDGELILTWGYATRNPLSGICYPWLLTTPALNKNKMFFARGSIKARDFLLSRFNRLDVIVAAEYLRAHAWLEWLGFSAPGAAFPVNGVPFVYMILERK